LAGKYLVGFTISWAANATGYRYAQIKVNDTTVISADDHAAMSALDSHRITGSALYSLAVADYVTISLAQVSGGSLNLESSASYSPEFWMTWLGA
jgi:hypothetical protein